MLHLDTAKKSLDTISFGVKPFRLIAHFLSRIDFAVP